MSKVTSKLQVTLPKALAEAYGIKPGDDIEWVEAGDSIRVIPQRETQPGDDVEFRLRMFDQATARCEARTPEPSQGSPASDRGWTREDLYQRDDTG